MSHAEQINALHNDLSAVIDRYRLEFEIPYASTVGVLQLLVAELCAEALEEDE